MSERAQQLLTAASLHEDLLAFLERDEAVFALTSQTLLYQDATGARKVQLRDLSRIHSGADGTLRIETPAGTALTASLIGFEPATVQDFFYQVKEATANAKKPAPVATPTPAPAVPTPIAAPTQPVVIPASSTEKPPIVISAAPDSQQKSLVTPVVIPEDPKPAEAKTKAPAPKKSKQKPKQEVTTEMASDSLADKAVQLLSWVGRMRFLSILMLISSMALAFFQWSNQQGLSAVWALITGGIGAVALYAFADLIQIMGLLAQEKKSQ